jgi:hypothetical protein
MLLGWIKGIAEGAGATACSAESHARLVISTLTRVLAAAA